MGSVCLYFLDAKIIVRRVRLLDKIKYQMFWQNIAKTGAQKYVKNNIIKGEFELTTAFILKYPK